MMKRAWGASGIAAVVGICLVGRPAAADDPPPAPIEVMVLGTFHMGNPGLDLHNIQVEPVTTGRKQAEIRAVADAIARFRPTAVAVERVAADPATLLDQKYPAFVVGDLETNPDERVQIGFRLANQLHLTRVYAIDEQAGQGEPTYFPYDKLAAWAQEHGRAPDLAAADARFAAEAARLELDAKRLSVAGLLLDSNRPEAEAGAFGHGRMYYKHFLAIGAGHEQPGADLNGRWYTRNAKIFAKLMQVTKPGDRVVVVYGAGHNFWLRHFATTVPGFRSVDPAPYLRDAGDDRPR